MVAQRDQEVRTAFSDFGGVRRGPSEEVFSSHKREMFNGLMKQLPEYHKNINGVMIRTATGKDIDRILELDHDVFAAAPYFEDDSYGGKEGIVKKYEHVLHRQNPIILVAEMDGKVVGFVWGYNLSDMHFKNAPALKEYIGKSDHPISYIDEMGTDQEYRGRGIATSLLESYKEIAETLGVPELILRTANPDAERLYNKEGYARFKNENGEEIHDEETGRPFLHLLL